MILKPDRILFGPFTGKVFSVTGKGLGIVIKLNEPVTANSTMIEYSVADSFTTRNYKTLMDLAPFNVGDTVTGSGYIGKNGIFVCTNIQHRRTVIDTIVGRKGTNFHTFWGKIAFFLNNIFHK